MEKYEKYKDSGFHWLGQVPEHWQRCRFKDFIQLCTQPSMDEHKIGLENIESGTGCFISTDTSFDGNGIAFQIDDLVYGKLRPYLQKVWKAEFSGNAVGDFFVFRARANSRPGYIKYLLLSDCFTKEADGSTYGTKMPRVSSDFILTLPFYLPTSDEQECIASFLDTECSKIDSLIATQQKRVELLKELRQSVITKAVTKGLDPDVKMKDSGVEWIGMVPEHWGVVKIRRVLDSSKDGIKIGPFGSSLTGKVGGQELPVKVYGQWNIVGRDFLAGNSFVADSTFDELKSYEVIPNDILISMMGTVGKCAVIPEGIQKGIMDSHVVKVRIDQAKIRSDYFEYLYDKDNSAVIINNIHKCKKGSIMDGLNSSIIKDFVICQPPLDEQSTIVSYLNLECKKIDELVETHLKRIGLLREYKQSLITEVVTGKRKVC